MSDQPKLPTLNQWFLSLEEGRQAVLREDKWMLAENAYQAGIEAARAACIAPAEPACWISKTGSVSGTAHKGWTPVYTHPANLAELQAENEKLQVEVERLRQFEAAYMEWSDKTEWVQQSAEVNELGKHRADVMRERIERLREEVERLSNALEVEKRSLQCEVNRRNQYAMESNELDRQLDETIAECDALKADAERYRWLRDNGETERGIMVLSVTGWAQPATAWALTFQDPDVLDACIDDEMARHGDKP
ncbi:hypothetical protein IQ22_04220 [Pseudomonas duriflava]|uniref:Uncharacterized protein n=1 Tax=Pseudomonas duriflava TaxID=459528 RepID=A0A562PUA4_9PSED|nr:hypothetical protein [Pseudomonas duriflava]TWI48027.1 hypothetical protein IQ22_04220 [Pseudomonas duriflava]